MTSRLVRVMSPLVLLMSTTGTAMAQSIQGTATYRERMALPPAAVFEAVLEDVSRADTVADTIARTQRRSPGNPPFAFTIAYDPAKIVSSHRYVVRARILVDGRPLFTTDAATPVITAGAPTSVSLLLRRVSASQSPPASGARPLEGTYWRAIELAGQPIATQTAQREAHLQFQSGRVSGSDGCNRLTGSFQLDGDRVTFGDMIGTQMACLNPSGTEVPFRAALKGATRLIISGERLELLDAAGTRLAVFAAGAQASGS